MIDLYVDFCSVLGSNWPDFPHVFRGFRGQIGFIPPLGAQLSLERSLGLPLKPQKPTLCRFEIDFCTIWLPFKGRMGRFLASKRPQYSRLTQRKVQKIPSPSGRGRRLQRQHLNKNFWNPDIIDIHCFCKRFFLKRPTKSTGRMEENIEKPERKKRFSIKFATACFRQL